MNTSLSKSRAALEQEAIDVLLVAAGPLIQTSKSRKDYTERCRGTLSTVHDHTLSRITASAATNHTLGLDLLEQIADGDLTEDNINDRCMLSSVFQNANMYYSEILRYLSGLSFYRGLTPVTDGHYPEERAKQASALIRLTSYLTYSDTDINTFVHDEDTPSYENQPPAYMVDDPALVNLIISSENPEVVADTIIARRLTSTDEIVSLITSMDSRIPALQHGSL